MMMDYPTVQLKKNMGNVGNQGTSHHQRSAETNIALCAFLGKQLAQSKPRIKHKHEEP
jgi:hypothetical protein